jgi:hypothetical protein
MFPASIAQLGNLSGTLQREERKKRQYSLSPCGDAKLFHGSGSISPCYQNAAAQNKTAPAEAGAVRNRSL